MKHIPCPNAHLGPDDVVAGQRWRRGFGTPRERSQVYVVDAVDVTDAGRAVRLSNGPTVDIGDLLAHWSVAS